MNEQQAYYIEQAIMALRRSVYRLALVCADDDTLNLVMGEIKMIERCMEQAGLHLLKEGGDD